MMERNIGKKQQNWPKKKTSLSLGLGSFLLFLFLSVSNLSAFLVDHTVATVGQHAITLKDLQVSYLSREILNRGRLPSNLNLLGDSAKLSKARTHRVNGVLIKNYLTATGLFTTIPPGDIAELEKKILRHFGSPEKREKYLARQGLDSLSLTEALEDRIRRQFFMEQFLGARLQPTENEISKHYQAHRESRFLGKSFRKVKNIVRADLRKEMVNKEFEKWLETEKRRTEVLILPLPSPKQKK